MSLPLLLDAFERSAAGRDLATRLPGRGASLDLGGLPGSSGAVLAAALVRSSSQRLMAIVAPTPADAERWLTDLQFLSDEAVFGEGVGERGPDVTLDRGVGLGQEVLRTLHAVAAGRLPREACERDLAGGESELAASLTAHTPDGFVSCRGYSPRWR